MIPAIGSATWAGILYRKPPTTNCCNRFKPVLSKRRRRQHRLTGQIINQFLQAPARICRRNPPSPMRNRRKHRELMNFFLHCFLSTFYFVWGEFVINLKLWGRKWKENNWIPFYIHWDRCKSMSVQSGIFFFPNNIIRSEIDFIFLLLFFWYLWLWVCFTIFKKSGLKKG